MGECIKQKFIYLLPGSYNVLRAYCITNPCSKFGKLKGIFSHDVDRICPRIQTHEIAGDADVNGKLRVIGGLISEAQVAQVKAKEEEERRKRDEAKQKAEPDVPQRIPRVIVNPFVLAKADRFSTFALETDTGAYTLTRSYIRNGYLPPAWKVRVEEFVNAFDYHYSGNVLKAFGVNATIARSPFRPKLHLLKVT